MCAVVVIMSCLVAKTSWVHATVINQRGTYAKPDPPPNNERPPHRLRKVILCPAKSMKTFSPCLNRFFEGTSTREVSDRPHIGTIDHMWITYFDIPHLRQRHVSTSNQCLRTLLQKSTFLRQLKKKLFIAPSTLHVLRSTWAWSESKPRCTWLSLS